MLGPYGKLGSHRRRTFTLQLFPGNEIVRGEVSLWTECNTSNTPARMELSWRFP
jgi:hypothetical protein